MVRVGEFYLQTFWPPTYSWCWWGEQLPAFACCTLTGATSVTVAANAAIMHATIKRLVMVPPKRVGPPRLFKRSRDGYGNLYIYR